MLACSMLARHTYSHALCVGRPHVGPFEKVLTVVVNCMIWDKHSNMYGLAALFISLGASAFYQSDSWASAVLFGCGWWM